MARSFRVTIFLNPMGDNDSCAKRRVREREKKNEGRKEGREVEEARSSSDHRAFCSEERRGRRQANHL